MNQRRVLSCGAPGLIQEFLIRQSPARIARRPAGVFDVQLTAPTGTGSLGQGDKHRPVKSLLAASRAISWLRRVHLAGQPQMNWRKLKSEYDGDSGDASSCPPETVSTGGKLIEVVRMTITDAGQRTLAE
jgi:hypothetical protein